MNVIPPVLPSGMVTYCDDVRHETSGKVSLIGIYSGQLIVFGVAPAIIPMLWAVVRWRVPHLTESSSVTFHLTKEKDGDGVSELLGETTVELPTTEQTLDLLGMPMEDRSEKIAEVQSQMRISPLVIEGNCTLRMRVFFQGDEYRIGALQVSVTQLPDEQSEQSGR